MIYVAKLWIFCVKHYISLSPLPLSRLFEISKILNKFKILIQALNIELVLNNVVYTGCCLDWTIVLAKTMLCLKKKTYRYNSIFIDSFKRFFKKFETIYTKWQNPSCYEFRWGEKLKFNSKNSIICNKRIFFQLIEAISCFRKRQTSSVVLKSRRRQYKPLDFWNRTKVMKYYILLGVRVAHMLQHRVMMRDQRDF